ncbi:Ig-like domain-containing protein [Cloacibacillus porcorum]|uniref:Ig-like domain-containing protein n=1 Tax=Cloacibacillus porcorum TaxID=1197717 RepID=UPI002672B62D|nr:Ig-like domain-containing protein [Cloacibacillus porcorum]
MCKSAVGAGPKETIVAPPHKTNRRLQLTALLLLLLFTALAAPSASRAAIAPVVPASDDRGVYLLSEPGHLLWFRDRVNAGSAEINAKLTKDIDLSEGGSPSHWTPIGQYTSGDRKDNGYAGSFDGGGFTVSGYIVASANVAGAKENNTLPLAAGFFGLVGQKAEIRGLTVGGVVSVDISNDRTISAGGIAGYNYGTITDNINSGEVSASGGLVKYVGGIAGFNNDTITNCANNGTVSASGGSGNDAGGIVGTSFAYTIANCTNSGDVSAFGDDTSSNSAGGIAGFNSNTITNCAHSGGTVSAFGGSSNSAGGISGYFYVKITNCANSGGTVTASGGSDNFAGGIAGISGGTITNNAHSGDVSASGGSNANHAGGIVGYNVTNNKVNISNSGWLVGNLEAIGGGDKGPDAVSADVVSLDAKAMKKVVTTVLPVERRLFVALGGDAPALTSYPGKAEDMTNYLSVSGDISVASPEIADISDLWPCAVSGKKTGVTAVSFDIDLKATDFSDKDNLKPLARSCVTGPLSFTVAVSGVPVTEVSLDLTELTLNIGESKKLTATVKPDDATYKAVTWTSADPAVASVDENGKVTALSAGTTVITARAGEKSATCTVTVAQPKTGGSSHGCAAGLGALSMLTLIPLWLRRKR